MFYAGYGDSLGDCHEKRPFSTPYEAKRWLVGTIQALADKERETGVNTYQAFSLACFRELEAPFCYRGPNQLLYFVVGE